MINRLFRSLLLTGFVFTLCIATATAQTGTIKGSIINKKTSDPVIGANIFIKSINKGAATDQNGKFTIADVPYGTYQLQITYVGFQSKTVIIDVDQDIVTVNQTIAPSTYKLNNLVVTAYGVKEKMNQLPYSAQNIETKDINSEGNSNVLSSLSGRVAGLDVRQNSGIGSSTSIIMRGFSSLTGNNQALIVVDGVPYINNSHTLESGYGHFNLGNSGVDINPDDIKSITVLKGAAAAALYGSQAANGAILIHTKSGAPSGGRVNITVKSSGGISLLDGSTIPKYQDKYGAGYVNSFQEIFNPFSDVPGKMITASRYQADASWGPAFDPSIKVYQWDAFYKDSPNYGKATPWVPAKHGPRYFFNTGVNLRNSIDVNGAFGDSSYYTLGYAQKNQRGIMPNSHVKNYKLHFKSGFHVNKRLTVTASANFTKVNGIGRPRRGYNSYMTVIRQFGQVNVDYKKQKEAFFRNRQNESWNLSTDRTEPLYDNNPYWDRYVNYESDGRKHFVGYGKADVKLLDWLNMTARISMDDVNQLMENRVNVGSAYTSRYSKQRIQTTEFNTDFLFNYNKQLNEKLSVDGVVGVNFRRRKVIGFSANTNGGLRVPSLYALSNSVNAINFPDETENRLGVNGFFASLNMHYNDFLNVTLSGRRDKSSTLPKRNNVYYYPSASLSINFSKFLNAKWLSLAKVHGSWAAVGNTAPVHSILDVYNRLSNFGSVPLYSLPSRRNDPNLKPEKTKSWEVGLQAGFLNNRVAFDATYYDQNSINQIIPVDITPATGYTSKYINSGKIANRGIELEIKTRPVESQNFNWQLKANWSKNINKVISLAPGIGYYQFSAMQGGGSIGAKEGGTYGQIRGSDYVYDKKTGKRVVGSDGNYLITSSTNNVIGNEMPDWRGGVENTFNYKNFTLSFLIDIRVGGDIYSVDQYYGQDTGKLPITVGLNKKGNPKRDPVSKGGGILKEGVTQDGNPNTTYAAVNFNSGYGYISNPNAGYVYDGSFVKLRHAAFSYSLPKTLLKETSVFNGITLSVVGHNLWIIHKNIPFADPEQNTGGNRLLGYQNSELPAIRSITFNVKLNF
jgi:TonB-linked SusC/RagA family outer membrane protein